MTKTIKVELKENVIGSRVGDVKKTLIEVSETNLNMILLTSKFTFENVTYKVKDQQFELNELETTDVNQVILLVQRTNSL